MEKTQQIAILAAGDFPTHPVPLSALHEADMVVCCDSAYRSWRQDCQKLRMEKPFVVIGDGDSLPDDERRELGSRWIQVTEQDFNDLHKAMSWATGEFPIYRSRFTILGATGHREDHTVGNISYLVTFAEEYPGIELEMLTDYGRFSVFKGSRTYNSFPGQQVSIFSLNPQMPFSGSGLQWPLDRFKASLWWQATLNSALGDRFSLNCDGWLVVFQTYEPK